MGLTRLLALPSAGLGHWPTPFHQVHRFGAEIGAEVWMKRDDIQGVALAGNKVRKFDLVVGQALADGRDTLVTTGAIQSNSARTGAAAAAACGMQSVLLLSGDKPDVALANHLLDEILGADVRFAGAVGWRQLNQGVDDIVTELNASGRRAFAAPVGCSSPLGSLGFARAFLELEAQCAATGVTPSAIVHTSTSAGTHAGLLVGRSLAKSNVRLIAVDVAAMFPDTAASYLDLAQEAAALLGHDLDLVAGDVEICATQLGEGYGIHTSAATDAIKLLARTEAIVTDPVYSGKGLAGLVELVGSGSVGRGSRGGPVVFWHTGGFHALFDPVHGSALVND